MQNIFDSISSKCCNIPGNKIQAEAEIEKYLSSFLNNPNENFSSCIDFLKEFQNDFITKNRHKYEIHIILDQNNNYFDCSINPEDGGNLTRKTINELKKKNLHLIHNHPSNGSLSTSDWNVLFHNPNLKMTAVNQYGSFFTGEVKKTSNTIEKDEQCLLSNIKKFENIKNQLQIDIGKMITSYNNMYISTDICEVFNIKTNELEASLNHYFGLALNKENFIKYVCNIVPIDTVNGTNLFNTYNMFEDTISMIKKW